jgi:hypothetical protein
VDWTTLTTRDRVAVFIPSDTAPQEIRDCLHEEVAQALGPLNDLYELSDSVFNDDNFHTVLTGFDMLALKVHYAPELANGMDRAAVAARLPALLARLNPGGGAGAPLPPTPTPRPWIEAIETALGPQGSPYQRRSAALQALQSTAHRVTTGRCWDLVSRPRGGPDSALAALSAAMRIGKEAVAMVNEGARLIRRIAQVLRDLRIPKSVLDFMNYPTRFDSTDTQKILDKAKIRVPVLEDYAWRLWDYWERHLDPDLSIDRSLRGAVKGKVVVITGGSSGIGEAAAIRVAEAGGKTFDVRVAGSRSLICDPRATREAAGR